MKILNIINISLLLVCIQNAHAGKPKELNVRTYESNEAQTQIVAAETKMLLVGTGGTDSGDLFAECKDINIGNSQSNSPYELNSNGHTETTIVIQGVVMNQCR